MTLINLAIWGGAASIVFIIVFLLGKTVLARWRLGYRLDNLDESLRNDRSFKIEMITSAPEGSEFSTSVPAILLDESE